MNRTELIERYNATVQAFELDPSQVALSAGGACVMHGLREETEDLDIHIPRSLYNRIRNGAVKRGKIVRLPVRPGQPSEMLQYHEWLSIAPLDHAFTTTMIIGVCVYDVRSLLIQKLQLNRPKDQKDILTLMAKFIDNA
jgi:hypothetical protein